MGFRNLRSLSVTSKMSKTPGGQQPSEKFLKSEAERQGLGAPNAPGHTEGKGPLETGAAEDAPTSNVGITAIEGNNPHTGGPNADGTYSIQGAPTNIKEGQDPTK